MPANNTYYNNNPKLKKVNVPVQWTQATLDEYLKCEADPEYFIENYVQIVHVDHGVVPFKMFDYQRNMVNTFHKNRFVIAKMPRQSGKSTTVTAFMLWKILFMKNQNCAILANKAKLACDLLDKIRMAYELLPSWMQQGVVAWGREMIELENGSKVAAAATSTSAVRGGSYNLILLDEFAFVPKNMAEAFFTSVYPTLSSGKTTQIIIVSTPHGMNHYYKMWMDAVEGRSSYKYIDVHWRDYPGHDDAWRDETIKNTSEQQFRQEFETEFLGSTDTLISGVKLRSMTWRTPTKDRWGLDIYIEPEKNHSYCICADTSHGVGLDYSAFTVIDITSVPYRLCAKFYDNQTSPMMFPEVIAYAGQKYNMAQVLGEINDVGQVVVDSLWRDLEYENVISTITKGRKGQFVNQGFDARTVMGLKMDTRVKRIGCANLKDLIEGDKLIIEDFHIIDELGTFVKTKQSYEAEEGHHDDLAMALVLFGWLVRQPWFKELSNTDVRYKIAQDRYEGIIEDLIHPGGYSDGMEDNESQLSLDPTYDRNSEDNWVPAERKEMFSF